MKILILDDETWRHDKTDERYPFDTIYHAYNIRQAQQFYEENVFDLILLDHDLGMTIETGYQFAKWMAEMPKKGTPRVIIHSWNPAGAHAMLYVLKESGFNVIKNPFSAD